MQTFECQLTCIVPEYDPNVEENMKRDLQKRSTHSVDRIKRDVQKKRDILTLQTLEYQYTCMVPQYDANTRYKIKREVENKKRRTNCKETCQIKRDVQNKKRRTK